MMNKQEIDETDKDCFNCKHNLKNWNTEEPCHTCINHWTAMRALSGWEPEEVEALNEHSVEEDR
jgi:hypothetical protein